MFVFVMFNLLLENQIGHLDFFDVRRYYCGRKVKIEIIFGIGNDIIFLVTLVTCYFSHS